MKKTYLSQITGKREKLTADLHSRTPDGTDFEAIALRETELALQELEREDDQARRTSHRSKRVRNRPALHGHEVDDGSLLRRKRLDVSSGALGSTPARVSMRPRSAPTCTAADVNSADCIIVGDRLRIIAAGDVTRAPFQAKNNQSGSAPRSGRGGRRFKSCHSDQHLAKILALTGTDCGTD